MSQYKKRQFALWIWPARSCLSEKCQLSRSQKCVHVPGLNTNHGQACSKKPTDKPLRQRSSLYTIAREIDSEITQQQGDVLRLSGFDRSLAPAI
jgi:hypothetical protein